MPARLAWKGTLKISLITIPIRVFPATNPGSDVSFRQLHRTCHTPIQMKKNRPGMLLTVLCRPEDCARLRQLVFTETTTLGVRERRETRAVLPRRHVSVQTRFGEVRMKLANLNGSVTNYAPEYEDCRRIAEQQRVPLKSVMQEAIRIYLEKENE